MISAVQLSMILFVSIAWWLVILLAAACQNSLVNLFTFSCSCGTKTANPINCLLVNVHEVHDMFIHYACWSITRGLGYAEMITRTCKTDAMKQLQLITLSVAAFLVAHETPGLRNMEE